MIMSTEIENKQPSPSLVHPAELMASTDTKSNTTPDPPPSSPKPPRSPLSKDSDRPSGLSRVFNPPKLEKKHSSGDLISRLKTRKILGVGETDNGDIHRSKISQVLGHNEHLYARLPKGFWVAHSFIAVVVSLEAFLLFATPSIAASIALIPSNAESQYGIARVAGASLCGMMIFIWSLIGTNDKYYCRTIILSVLTYQSLTLALCLGSSIFQGNVEGRWLKTIALIRLSVTGVCLWYFYQIGQYSPFKGVRPSYKSRNSSPNASAKEH